MLGVDHQSIYCKVTKCRHNEEHKTRDGRTNKVIETWHTCDKEDININSSGMCTEAARLRRKKTSRNKYEREL